MSRPLTFNYYCCCFCTRAISTTTTSTATITAAATTITSIVHRCWCCCIWSIQVVSDHDGRTYCLNHAVECLRSSPSTSPNYKLFIRCEEVGKVFQSICNFNWQSVTENVRQIVPCEASKTVDGCIGVDFMWPEGFEHPQKFCRGLIQLRAGSNSLSKLLFHALFCPRMCSLWCKNKKPCAAGASSDPTGELTVLLYTQ